MLNSFGQLEVILKKSRLCFKATTPDFPDCSGSGKTEDEALSNLSESISIYLSKSLKNSFNCIFKSNNYTQILVDSSKENKEQRRIFDLMPAGFPGEGISIKIKPSFNINEEQVKEILKKLEMNNFAPPKGHFISSPFSAIQQTGVMGRPEDFLFGIPFVSFN